MTKPDPRDFEERYRSCFVDLSLKTLGGFLIGSMLGSFFLRRLGRLPMLIGTGLGIGMAYGNCENSLNGYLMSLDPKICHVKKGP